MKTIRSLKLENLRLSFVEIYRYDKRIILILFAEVIIKAFLPFPNVILSGWIVDGITAGEDFRVVVFYVILLFGANFLLTAGNTVLAKCREYAFIKLTNKLDNEINQKCMQIDFERFNDSSVQDRILLVNQAVRGNNFFTSLTTVFETISQIIMLVGIVFIMTKLNVWLLAVAFAVIILQAFLHYISLKYDRKYKADSVHDQRSIGYVSQLAKDIGSKKDIVTFNMGDYILKKIEAFQKAVLLLEKRRIWAGGLIGMLIYILSIAFQISAYLLIGVKAFQGKISIGDFTMGIASLINFMSASAFVATNIVNFNDSFYYIKQYNSFQKFKSKYNAESDVTLDEINLDKVEFEFRNVSFRYPNSTSYVLKNINITLRNKEKLGVVGFNGAGKTSFVLLLTRMYDPTEGMILMNGIDIRRIKYSDYQKIFATVNQDFSLMAFSLLSNIAIKDKAIQEEIDIITELFDKNGLGDRLKKWYRGLDTPITKKLSASGVDLSGGERQKIAIIRALYKNSRVLVLDEPTSALDPVAESEVYQKFAEMSEKKTTVFISHRIYSTRFCDKIAVFDNGEIVEYGTFDELLARKGLYYDFFQQQAEKYK